MDAIDLETKNGVNCVTRWADRAGDDYKKAMAAGTNAKSEYKPKKGSKGKG